MKCQALAANTPPDLAAIKGIAADAGNAKVEAILVSSPSTRTQFAALGVPAFADLHSLDPVCRAIPRAGST